MCIKELWSIPSPTNQRYLVGHHTPPAAPTSNWWLKCNQQLLPTLTPGNSLCSRWWYQPWACCHGDGSARPLSACSSPHQWPHSDCAGVCYTFVVAVLLLASINWYACAFRSGMGLVLPCVPAGSEVVATGLLVHQDHFRKWPTPSLQTSVVLSLEKVAYFPLPLLQRRNCDVY